jgi:hypothetical protein
VLGAAACAVLVGAVDDADFESELLHAASPMIIRQQATATALLGTTASCSWTGSHRIKSGSDDPGV